jgi:predicted 2-oxoglutarate/Fe(II)-dependent dioxygenase YbiX
LSPEDIAFMVELYGKLDNKENTEFLRRDFNLFNVYKIMLGGKKLSTKDLQKLKNITFSIRDCCGARNIQAAYFLKYIPGSFTNIHIDNPQRVFKTAITLVDASPTLIGGEAIILRDIEPTDLHDGIERPGSVDKNDNKGRSYKIPIVAHQDIGSTLIYNNDVLHGVSKVIEGYRLVHVLWLG